VLDAIATQGEQGVCGDPLLQVPELGARWRAGSGGGSTRAVIGACCDGPFGVDLARDGPHGLVAGTTGAKDIEEYAERGSRQPRYRPLPRLVIVIEPI